MNALNTLTHCTNFLSVDGHLSLSRKIVALHLVYGQCSSKLLQFGQLVSHRPAILRSLSNLAHRDPPLAIGMDPPLAIGEEVRILDFQSTFIHCHCLLL